jgi:hypothetical protein
MEAQTNSLELDFELSPVECLQIVHADVVVDGFFDWMERRFDEIGH